MVIHGGSTGAGRFGQGHGETRRTGGSWTDRARGPAGQVRPGAIAGVRAHRHPGRAASAGRLHSLRRQAPAGRGLVRSGRRAAVRQGWTDRGPRRGQSRRSARRSLGCRRHAQARSRRDHGRRRDRSARRRWRSRGRRRDQTYGRVSVSGRDDGADWKAAVQAAAASGRTTWTGSVGDTGRLYVATAASLDHARAFVIASGDASRLVESSGQERQRRPGAA
jgi:hypothetical protein